MFRAGCTEAGKATARAGSVGPLLGCSWRRPPAGGQDLCRKPPSDPRAPACLSPHPSGSWTGGCPTAPPHHPAALLPEHCLAAGRRLRGARLPWHTEIPIYGNGRERRSGNGQYPCAGALLGWGVAAAPSSPARKTAEPSPGAAHPAALIVRVWANFSICRVFFLSRMDCMSNSY